VVAIDERGVRWRWRVAGGALGPLAVDERGTIYGGSADGTAFALRDDGHLVWRARVGEPVGRSPVLGERGGVYVAAGSTLVALDVTGRQRWRRPLGGAIVGGPLVADDGTVYATIAGGAVIGLDGSGRDRARLPLPSPPTSGLALADHRLWVGLGDATLHLLAIPQRGLARSPWAEARGGPANAGAVAILPR